jgi:glycosyltransferase involved in cell wall biosynthesis
MVEQRKVCYVFPVSHRFRYPFHIALRDELARHSVTYKVIYCAPFGPNISKKDTIDVPWGLRVPMLKFGPLILQFGFREMLRSDFIIIQQENRLLINYILQILDRLGLKRVAFFGHGRNFQSASRQSFAERWKRFWATKVSWWFGYTHETKELITGLGFPSERVTVFNNAIDTKQIEADFMSITDDVRCEVRELLNTGSENIAVYVGGLYAEKRIRFLIEASKRIRQTIPDFVLLVIGGGPDEDLVKVAARENHWIHYMGPQFGIEKARLLSVSKVFLMPGLVGLSILDAFCYGTPIVTTDVPFHSPEIAYLEDGVNGVMVRDHKDIDAYAAAASRVLTDHAYRQLLVDGGRKSLKDYSIENMSYRFAIGVLNALELK